MADYKAFAFYTNDGIGQSGLTVTCDVYTSSGIKVADNQPSAEIVGGFYTYTYTGIDDDYLFVFKTASSSVDQKHLPVLYGDRRLLPEDILNLDDSIETNYSLKEILRLISSIIAGKLSGADTPHVVFRDVNDTKDRVSATVDGIGNRVGVVADVS